MSLSLLHPASVLLSLTPSSIMPLLEGPGSRPAVNGSLHNGFTSPSPVVESLPDPQPRQAGLNGRQRIVVVGLGMVAVSFMYVD